MSAARIDLDAITIASPCSVPWDSMSGDERRRFCGQCRLHVHDTSRMTRAEVESLVETTGGHCCLKLWRRADGRVVTQDCGRVRLALERRVRAIRAVAAAVLAFVGLGGCAQRAPYRPYVTGAVAAPPPSPTPPPPNPPVPAPTK